MQKKQMDAIDAEIRDRIADTRNATLEECALIADRHIVSSMSNGAYNIGREIRALKTSTPK